MHFPISLRMPAMSLASTLMKNWLTFWKQPFFQALHLCRPTAFNKQNILLLKFNLSQSNHQQKIIMKYGYWLPVFGGWLRNVENENMQADWNYVKRLAIKSEEWGYDVSL